MHINGNSSLTREETMNLLKEIRKGSIEAREKLAINNIGLVKFLVYKRFYNTKYDKEDLISIGIIGLINAIDTFDISKGFEFSTYVSRCITNEILMFIRKNEKNSNNCSLDEVELILKNDNDITYNYEQNEIYRIINTLVDKLDGKDKIIIKLYFGFDNNSYTQEEIATKLKVSQAYVSRLLNKALRYLKYQLEKLEIIETNSFVNKKKIKNKKTIFDYFKNNSREEVINAIMELSNYDKELIYIRFGKKFNEYNSLDFAQTNRLYQYVIPKLKKTLN